MAKISERNTKNEIFEAYKEAIQKVNKLEESKFNPIAEIETKKNEEIKKDADVMVGMGILNEDIINSYNNVNKAIELKKNELNELYNIETEANTLAALLDARANKLNELDAKISEKSAEYEKLDAELSESYKAKIKSLNDETCEYKKLLQKDRDREKEEYDYNLARDRKIEADKWEDEKEDRIKEVEEREEEVSIRELTHDNLVAEIAELHRELDEVPAQIKAAQDEASAKTKSSLDKSYHFEKAAMEKDFKHMEEIYRSKIDTLEEKINDLVATNDELRENLNDSYEKVQTIASEAVKNSGVKVLDTNNK